MRIAPFNVASALLVILAGGGRPFRLCAVGRRAGHPGALAADRPPGRRFEIQPAHFVERHGALIIVALGESVATVGIAASREDVTGSIVAAAVLRLALTAGCGGCTSAPATTTRPNTPSPRRPRPSGPPRPVGVLLRSPTGAARHRGDGRRRLLTIGHAAQAHPVGQAVALSGGVTLFLAGGTWPRAALGIGRPLGPAGHRRLRAGRDRAGATVAVEATLGVLLAALVLMLAGERYAAWRWRPASYGDGGSEMGGVIGRYTRPGVGRVWSGAHEYELWCRVETLVLEAHAAAGTVPADSVAPVRAAARRPPSGPATGR